MSSIYIERIPDSPKPSATINDYQAILHIELQRLFPLSNFPWHFHNIRFSVRKLTETSFYVFKHQCTGTGKGVELKVVVLDGLADGVCLVHMEDDNGVILETWKIPQTKDGKYKIQAGTIGTVGRLLQYGMEDSDHDDLIALVAGKFVLDLIDMIEKERTDKEDMVEAAEDWVFV